MSWTSGPDPGSPRNRVAFAATATLIALTAYGVIGPAALAGTTWDGGGGANATWSLATNWNADSLPDLSSGSSAIVFSTVNASGAVTQLDGGLIDILSLRSDVFTGQTVSVGTTGLNVTGLSVNSGTLVVRSGTITKANQAALVINSTLQLVSDGYFSSTNSTNTGLLIAGPITEDATSRNVVINASAGAVYLAGLNTYTGTTTVERGTIVDQHGCTRQYGRSAGDQLEPAHARQCDYGHEQLGR